MIIEEQRPRRHICRHHHTRARRHRRFLEWSEQTISFGQEDHPEVWSIDSDKLTALRQWIEKEPPLLTPEETFNQKVLPLLTGSCAMCHANPAPDYAAAKSMIVPGQPDESGLVLKASGVDDHSEVWGAGSQELETLRSWIASET